MGEGVTWDKKVPFDENGHQRTWTASWLEAKTKRVPLEEAEFADWLEYKGYSRGRSAVQVTMVRSNGLEVHLSLADFMEYVPHLDGGDTPKWQWTFVKRGSSYFCTRKVPK